MGLDVDNDGLSSTRGRDFQFDELREALESGRLTGHSLRRNEAETLITLLDLLDWKIDAHQLAASLPHFPGEFGVEEFRSTLANLGYTSRIEKLPGSRLCQCPPTAMVIDKHSQIWLIDLQKGCPDLVTFRRSGDRPISQKIRQLKVYRTVQFDELSSEIVELKKQSEKTSWMGDVLGRLAPHMRLLFILALLSGGTSIVIAFGITMLFDIVLPTRNLSTLSGILIGAALLFIFDFFIRSIRANCIGHITGRLEYLLGRGLFSKLLGLPSRMISQASLSDQLSKLRQFESVRDLFSGTVASIIFDLPFVALLLSIIAFIEPRLSLAILLCATLLIVSVIAATPNIRRETRKLSVLRNTNSTLVLEILSQRNLIGRRGLISAWANRYCIATKRLAQQRRKLGRTLRVLESISYASLPLATGCVVAVGASLVIDGGLTGGELLGVTILSWRLFAPIQQSLKVLAKAQDIQVLIRQIDMMMRIDDEVRSRDRPLDTSSAGSISTDGVVVRHSNSIAPTLMNICLEIPQGAFVTVGGEAGSGKSTLLRTLAGQIEPQAGSVRMNNVNISQLPHAYRSRTVVLVPQTPLFVYGTIAQNLRFADPMASLQKLEAVLNEVGVGSWLRSLPNGLETRIDPSSQNSMLPSSIRNCIGVAQALLLRPSVLLLDETVGGLDGSVEDDLLSALEARKKNMTVILATHRPSIINRSDACIEMSDRSATMRNFLKDEKVAFG